MRSFSHLPVPIIAKHHSNLKLHKVHKKAPCKISQSVGCCQNRNETPLLAKQDEESNDENKMLTWSLCLYVLYLWLCLKWCLSPSPSILVPVCACVPVCASACASACTCACVSVPVCLSVPLPAPVPVCLCLCLCNCLCPCLCLCLCLYLFLSVCLYPRLKPGICVYLYLSLKSVSVCLSVCLSVPVPVSLYEVWSLCLCLCLSVCLSVCVSVYPVFLWTMYTVPTCIWYSSTGSSSFPGGPNCRRTAEYLYEECARKLIQCKNPH